MHIAAHAFLGPDISEQITGFSAEFRRFSAGMDPVLPGWLPLPHLLRSKRSRDRLRVRLQELIDERRREPADPPDFLQTICDATKWPQSPCRVRYRAVAAASGAAAPVRW
jgi:sterol 14-demethylase